MTHTVQMHVIKGQAGVRHLAQRWPQRDCCGVVLPLRGTTKSGAKALINTTGMDRDRHTQVHSYTMETGLTGYQWLCGSDLVLVLNNIINYSVSLCTRACFCCWAMLWESRWNPSTSGWQNWYGAVTHNYKFTTSTSVESGKCVLFSSPVWVVSVGASVDWMSGCRLWVWLFFLFID